jgi:hypothetical protein
MACPWDEVVSDVLDSKLTDPLLVLICPAAEVGLFVAHILIAIVDYFVHIPARLSPVISSARVWRS